MAAFFIIVSITLVIAAVYDARHRIPEEEYWENSDVHYSLWDRVQAKRHPELSKSVLIRQQNQRQRVRKEAIIGRNRRRDEKRKAQYSLLRIERNNFKLEAAEQMQKKIGKARATYKSAVRDAKEERLWVHDAAKEREQTEREKVDEEVKTLS
jgi:hypothetical protein